MFSSQARKSPIARWTFVERGTRPPRISFREDRRVMLMTSRWASMLPNGLSAAVSMSGTASPNDAARKTLRLLPT